MHSLRLYSLSILLLLCTSCAYTVFAPPKALYKEQDSIGVKYRSKGIQSHDEAEKAMKLVSDHCNNGYTVTNRSESNGWTTIDAVCD